MSGEAMASENSTSKVVLYDIECKSSVCWSPNTHKPRTVLAYKKIPYTTRWISYPDLEKTLRHHGQEDAKTVTAPVLQDGDKYVPDSWAIAKYLEEKVPEPSIFPGGIEAHEKFSKYVDDEIKGTVFFWILYQIPPILDERGAEYFIRTREQALGPLRDRCKPDDEVLPKLRGALTPVFHSLRSSEAYIMGKEFSYADSILLGILQWVHEADKEKLNKILALDSDGHFSAWWKRCEPLMTQMD